MEKKTDTKSKQNKKKMEYIVAIIYSIDYDVRIGLD